MVLGPEKHAQDLLGKGLAAIIKTVPDIVAMFNSVDNHEAAVGSCSGTV